MPSLRRAFSTPSVRASPYPTTTLPGSRSYHRHHHHHPHLHGSSGGGYHRRSSGSDVSARKVLADIDWWRVADGQREPGGEGAEEEDEEGEEERDVGGRGGDEENPASTVADPADPEAEVAAVETSNLAHDAIPATDRASDGDDDESAAAEPEPAPERPSTPVASESPVHHHLTLTYSPQSYLFGQLASFAAAGPRTPTRRTVSESSVSSASSLESTPEVLRTPIERLSFAGMGFADPGLDMPLIHMRLASLDTVPHAVAPKHLFPEQGCLDNNILPDALMSHDDLFA